MTEINRDFLMRMRGLLDKNDCMAFIESLREPPLRYARKNPLKCVPDEMIAAETGGFPFLPESAKPGLGALHAAGAYYVQEPAAVAVGALIVPFLPKGARVLDMCAAPGGKVTAAACARSDCMFLANDAVFSRAKILMSNVERLGLRNCTVCSLRPDEISRIGAGLFDAVIADVPCSGEGMARKTEFADSDLSDASVQACVVRAEKILDECNRCLKPGGILAFSTCTFNRAENEEQVLRLIRKYGYEPIAPAVRPPHSREGFNLPQAVRFFPQDGGGEGHFACLLQKTQDSDGTTARSKSGKRGQNANQPKKLRYVTDMLEKITSEKFPTSAMLLCGDACEYIPENYPFADFPALRRGVRLADFIGDRAVPHHNFATAANPDMLAHSPAFMPSDRQIASFLAGETFQSDEKNGYRVVRVAGITLGLVKISDGVAKNHYPKGLRLG